MTVVQKSGDVFSTRMPALGHGVNTKGVMGAGIAKFVRAKNPEVYYRYRAQCQAQAIKPGDMLPVQTQTGRWILNLASQDFPGADARLDWLEASLRAAFAFVAEQQLVGFAIPRIGAGIGGLDWEDVAPVIEQVATSYPDITLEVWTFDPGK